MLSINQYFNQPKFVRFLKSIIIISYYNMLDNRLNKAAYLHHHDPNHSLPSIPEHSENVYHTPSPFPSSQNFFTRNMELQSYYKLKIQELNSHISVNVFKQNQNNVIAKQSALINNKDETESFNAKDGIRLRHEVQQYRDTLSKMYMLVQQKQNQNNMIRQLGHLTVYQKNQDQAHLMGNQINNLILDRDILGSKLQQQAQKHNYDIQSLIDQVHDKNNQNHQFRKKITDLLDAKRRLEEQASALRFANDTIRSKLEADNRQLKLKMENMQRSFHQTIQNKLLENAHLEGKLGQLQNKNRLLNQQLARIKGDKNRLQHQLDIQKRENRDKRQTRQQVKFSEQDENGITKGLNYSRDQRMKRNDQGSQRQRKRHGFIQNQIVSPKISQQLGTTGFRKIDMTEVNTLIPLLQRTRTQILDYIFKLFCKSIDSASIKKQNSLVLFMINLKDIKQKSISQLEVVLQNYRQIRLALKRFISLPKIQLILGRGIESQQARDSVNAWVEGTLVYTIQQKQKDLKEKNRFFLYLFRLLTIKYRIHYPLKSSSVKLDLDLQAALNHKIVYALRKQVNLIRVLQIEE